MSVSSEVIAGLRAALASSSNAFAAGLEGRIRQLAGNMVDGRVLPKGEKETLQAAILDLVRLEALPHLRARSNDALRVLDLLRAYGWTALERERAGVMAERAERFRPPARLDWPEVAQIRDLTDVAPPIADIAFVDDLVTQGLGLPPELVALYAAGDGFDLACIIAPHVPVFALLPSVALDVSAESEGYPRRVTTFQGGDQVELAVGRDAQGWSLVYEYEYEPVAKRPFDLRALLAFATARARATDAEELAAGLSWDTFFRAL